jgi:hypothetical protein
MLLIFNCLKWKVTKRPSRFMMRVNGFASAAILVLGTYPSLVKEINT